MNKGENSCGKRRKLEWRNKKDNRFSGFDKHFMAAFIAPLVVPWFTTNSQRGPPRKISFYSQSGLPIAEAIATELAMRLRFWQ